MYNPAAVVQPDQAISPMDDERIRRCQLRISSREPHPRQEKRAPHLRTRRRISRRVNPSSEPVAKPTGEVCKYDGVRTSEPPSFSSAQVGLVFQHNVLALLPVIETLLDVNPVSQANGLVLSSVNVIMLEGIL